MAFDTELHFRLAEDHDQKHLNQLLAGRFDFTTEPPVSEEWVFYDTFDWRLFNASLALRKADQEIVLANLADGESMGSLASSSVPRFAWDLPDSQLRQCLEPLIKMRALLSLVEVNIRFLLFRILNSDEKR